MTTKLSTANLPLLEPEIQVPQYDRSQVGQGIVHIGVGGFHRAHQTVYTEDLFNQNRDLEWGFCRTTRKCAMRWRLKIVFTRWSNAV